MPTHFQLLQMFAKPSCLRERKLNEAFKNTTNTVTSLFNCAVASGRFTKLVPAQKWKTACHEDYVLIVFLTAVMPVLAAIYTLRIQNFNQKHNVSLLVRNVIVKMPRQTYKYSN